MGRSQSKESVTRGQTHPANAKGPLAHPPEPGYPCCVSALGELAWMAPREEPSASLPARAAESASPAAARQLSSAKSSEGLIRPRPDAT